MIQTPEEYKKQEQRRREIALIADRIRDGYALCNHDRRWIENTAERIRRDLKG